MLSRCATSSVNDATSRSGRGSCGGEVWSKRLMQQVASKTKDTAGDGTTINGNLDPFLGANYCGPGVANTTGVPGASGASASSDPRTSFS